LMARKGKKIRGVIPPQPPFVAGTEGEEKEKRKKKRE
jgi:hypothetical protein